MRSAPEFIIILFIVDVLVCSRMPLLFCGVVFPRIQPNASEEKAGMQLNSFEVRALGASRVCQG